VNRLLLRLPLLAILVTSGWLAGCSHGCSGEPVAVVASAAGVVERDRVGAIETWQPAPLDAGLALGEAVRTGADGSAQLRLRGGGGLRMGANALVRFGGQPDETPTLELGGGEIEVEAGEALDIITEFGAVRVAQGGRVRATRGEDGTQLEVLFGLAQLEDGTSLGAGETRAAPPPVANSAAASARAEAAAEQRAAAAREGGEAPEAGALAPGAVADGPRLASVSPVEFTVSGGAGGVIHHPSPPAVVGIRTGCPGGEVRVEGSSGTVVYAGEGTIGVRLARGRHRYEVLCQGQPSAEGRFTVTSDSGRQRLNTVSQRHSVDADGRRYTFLYEGALPTLSLRWPNAPAAEQYTLRLTGTRGRSRITSNRATASLPRSALREGEMTFQFEAAGRTSPVTRVLLRYDTATPTAFVASPADRSFGAGATVSVSGTAQPGSRVAVGAQELAVDGRGAFTGTGTADSGGLAVRITTSSQGVHYFVRRASGG
jgi:hypothetical protein